MREDLVDKFKQLFLVSVLVASVSAIGCGDSGGSNGNGGGGEACTVNDCATNDALMAACVNIYEDCLDVGERSEAECRDLAESANCRLDA